MERIVSTFEKAISIKESKGEIVYLSRRVSVTIDRCISNSINKKRKRRK